MKKIMLIVLCLVFSLNAISMASRHRSDLLEKKEEVVLFPGQTAEILGIKLHWKGSSPEQVGTLDITGPKTQMKDQVISCFYLYIDDVVLNISPKFKAENGVLKVDSQHTGVDKKKPVSIQIMAAKQASVQNLSGSEWDIKGVYVSSTCPLTLHDWRFRVSKERETLPDNFSYYMLEAENPDTGEQWKMPLSKGAKRKAGRYTLSCQEMYPVSRTARLSIEAEVDKSLRGRYAFVERFSASDYEDSRLEEALATLGKKYGFEVEWAPYPGHPESAQVLKDMTIKDNFIGTGYDIEVVLERFLLSSGIKAEWNSPDKVKISYSGYEKHLQEKARTEKRESLKKQKIEQFHKEYPLVTKVYKFDSISPQSAKTLIEPHLSEYSLFVSKVSGDFVIRKDDSAAKFESLVSKITESAIADEKADALILSATPKTHDKLKDKIEKINAVLKSSDRSSGQKPFEINLSLLLGKRSEDPALDEEKKKESLTRAAAKYGIAKQDLEFFDFDTLEKLGAAKVQLLPQHGQSKSQVSLVNNLFCYLEYIDWRDPYLIVRVRLRGPYRDRKTLSPTTRDLLESTVYLEAGKATPLGITNIDSALILVIEVNKI